MPRPNQPRDIRGEDYLAERVRIERTRREWTPERLAKEMTEAGCPIQTSAIYRIEGGNPRRRITVEELIGFSRVFSVPVEDLLISPDLVVSQEAVDLVRELVALNREQVELSVKWDDTFARLSKVLAEHGEIEPYVLSQLERGESEQAPDNPELARVQAQWLLAGLKGQDRTPEDWRRYTEALETAERAGGDSGGEHPEAP